MGIRLQKRAGWGLDDLVPGEDPRVNWEGRWTQRSASGIAYLNWLTRKYGGQRHVFSMDFILLRSADAARYLRSDVSECVSYDHEDRQASVLVIRPFAYPDWSREDDTLDYSAEQLRPDGFGSYSSRLPAGIFPFNALYMDAETGEDINGHEHHLAMWWNVTANLEKMPLREDTTPEDRRATLDKVTADVLPQYASYEEARRRVVPRVPGEVRDVCEYLQVLKGKETWRQLRPVLATWLA
jgi:hypothetical protein